MDYLNHTALNFEPNNLFLVTINLFSFHSVRIKMAILLSLTLLLQLSQITSFTITPQTQLQLNTQNAYKNIIQTTSTTHHTKLYSLKPAAIPLMEAGKALARSGELLIDYTSTSEYNLYAGGLSNTGASIRNAGDCVAQAGASMRFKTAGELVCDELRESATCISEGNNEKLPKGVDDANVDGYSVLAGNIENLIPSMECVGVQLEMAGERIMKMDSVANIGSCLVESGDGLTRLAMGIQKLGEEFDAGVQENQKSIDSVKSSSNRMLFAAEKMKEAGNNLKGVEKPKKKGKAWLKG